MLKIPVEVGVMRERGYIVAIDRVPNSHHYAVAILMSDGTMRSLGIDAVHLGDDVIRIVDEPCTVRVEES